MCAALCEACDIDPKNIKGHKDFAPTECPGKWLYSQLQKLQNEVAAKLAS
jgi:N-acetylmuramoyl-L-alanine amidase CwlA